jgi:phosphopantetheinyl transferase
MRLPKQPAIWPALPAALDDDGLALVLLTLPAGTLRPAARRLARQALRPILSTLLDRPSATLALQESPRGPLLHDAARDLRISLAYAADRVLIGIADGRALGVDLVRIDTAPPATELAALCRLYLPAPACRAVLDAPAGTQAARFAQGWARMEACSKCLALPLTEIDAHREQALTSCELVAYCPPDGYALAVALSP